MLVIVAVLVVWIGISIHNATKQVAMAVNTVEVEPVQKRDLSDTISVKGNGCRSQQHECDVKGGVRDHFHECAGRRYRERG